MNIPEIYDYLKGIKPPALDLLFYLPNQKETKET